jgi:dipeptidyl aminopeptidase/acylaminoacyl peptidase
MHCPAGLLLLVVLPQGLSAQQTTPRAFTPNDWYRVTTVSAPALSPDGKQVAFTVTTVATVENKRHSEIWAVPTTGAAPLRLTSPSVESSQPRWSPDGRLLLFTSTRPGAQGRTFALRMDRPSGEAFEYDSLPAGSLTADRTTIAWSEAATPDTTTKADDPYGKMKDPASRPPFGAITKPLDPARFDGRHYVDLPIVANGRGYLANPREARSYRPRQIWVQKIGPGDEASGRPYAITRTRITDAN